MVNKSRWFFHPIFVFVFSIVALGASLVLYIYWYVGVSAGLADVVRRFNLDKNQIFTPQTWVVILILSILVGIILAGIFIIFVYNQKLIQVYRMQHNFINTFTHELKTPLTSISLYLETFLRHELPREDQVKYTRYMLQDVNRLSDNTSRILNLAQIESKSFSGEFVTVDLVEFVTHFFDQNGHLFQNCHIVIHNPSKQSFPYSVIVSLFEMLLMNLASNAIKYNDSETPRVDIVFEPHLRKLHLRFEDNGIGFEKKESKKIFKKFYQIGRADDMTAKGSGIGLYLSHLIIKLHGGSITAESKGPGMGSIFTITLPRRLQAS